MRFLRSFFLPFLLILYSHVSSNYSTPVSLKTQGVVNHRAHRSIPDQPAVESDSTKPTNDDIENLSIDELQKLKKAADDKLTETRNQLSEKKTALVSKKDEAKVPIQDYEDKKSKFAELDAIAKGMNKELNDAIDEFNIADEESNSADELFNEFTDAKAKVETDTVREKYVKDAPNRQSIAKIELDDWENKCKPLKMKMEKWKTDVQRTNDTVIDAEAQVRDQEKKVKECSQNCDEKQLTLNDLRGELRTAQSELDKAVEKLALAIECPGQIEKITVEVNDLNNIMKDHAKAVSEAHETLVASTALSKDPKFDGIEAKKTAANEKFKQKKEAKELAEANAKTPQEVKTAREAARKVKLELKDATEIKSRIEGEILNLSNTIGELQKKIDSEEARVEKLRKVLEKKSEEPSKGASWLIAVYVVLALAVVAAIAFGFVKWGLPRLKLAKNARNGTQSTAKDSAVVPASEKTGSKQSEVSQKQAEGDSSQVPATSTVAPTPIPLTASQTPTKLETATKLATELETAAQAPTLLESAGQTESLVESAAQTPSLAESAAQLQNEIAQITTLLESATKNTTNTSSVGSTPTKACYTGLSPSKPAGVQEAPKRISVKDIPRDTENQRILIKNLREMQKKGLKVKILRHKTGGLWYRAEDKKGRAIEEWRYFANGFSSHVQTAGDLQEGTINYKNNRTEITKRNNSENVEHDEPNYGNKMTTMYNTKDGPRRTAASNKEEKRATKESLDLQTAYRNKKEAQKEEEKNLHSHSNSEKDGKTSERSEDREEKSNSSRKETRTGIANKKRKSGKGKNKRKRPRKKQKKSDKDDNSASSDSEYSKNRSTTKPQKKRSGGNVESAQASVEPGESNEFYNPKRAHIQQRMKDEPTKPLTKRDLIKIAKEMEKSMQNGTQYTLSNKDRIYIIRQGKRIFKREPRYKKLAKGAVNICADIHGNSDNLLQMFAVFGGIDSEEFKKQRFIFLGDYVDRGLHSDECLTLLLILKIVYPDNFTLLRGNHETYATSIAYGFQRELMAKMGKKEGAKFHEFYCYMFSYMPLCCTCNKLFFMHGGIPRYKDLGNTWNIEKINDKNLVPEFLWDVRDNVIACQLTWGDPRWGIEGFQDSSRGVAWEFGEDVAQEFCKANNLRGVVRGHQKIQNGYEFFAGNLLVSLFTCSNYETVGGKPNNAAFMTIDKYNAAYFHIFTNNSMSSAKLEHDMNIWTTNFHVEQGSGEEWEIENKDESETVDRCPKKPFKRPTGGRTPEGNKKPGVKRLDPKPAVKAATPGTEPPEKKGGSPYANSIPHIPTKSGREVE